MKVSRQTKTNIAQRTKKDFLVDCICRTYTKTAYSHFTCFKFFIRVFLFLAFEVEQKNLHPWVTNLYDKLLTSCPFIATLKNREKTTYKTINYDELDEFLSVPLSEPKKKKTFDGETHNVYAVWLITKFTHKNCLFPHFSGFTFDIIWLFTESWIELTNNLIQSCPDRVTPPLPFSSGEEYLRLLKEAQKESNPSSLISSRRDSPKVGSPKSPPNSPNPEPLTNEEELRGVFINYYAAKVS
jgi:hypothetical protein